LGVLGIDMRIILKWILKEQIYGRIGWIDLTQDSIQWQALVNTLMNLRILENGG
jgi:hypothetical protein